jgi:hypothetical protein
MMNSVLQSLLAYFIYQYNFLLHMLWQIYLAQAIKSATLLYAHRHICWPLLHELLFGALPVQ